MPGGDATAWPEIKPIFQAIAAKVKDTDGKESRVLRLGRAGGAGHFVKMVHNGIEYGDMQLICESYNLLKDLCGLSPSEMSDVFAKWNKGVLDSYLIEITSDILAYVDPETKKPMVDVILDTAGQKGTGKWTVDIRDGPGRSADADRGSRVQPVLVGSERRGASRRRRCWPGRACRRLPTLISSSPTSRWRSTRRRL